MITTTREALRLTKLAPDTEIYRLVQLPKNAITLAAGVLAEVGSPFTALIIDKDEVTLVLPHEAIEEFSGRLRDATLDASNYRLITFDAVLPAGLVGYMAAISAAVARVGVSIIPLGAFSRDHILVRESQFDAAMDALQSMISEA
ncbi:MAG: ACT domain-containing protein [Anaerolineae bacterium]|nr:ACT domain-containing protein [Chloroflexota bacterium]MBP6297725.1 ACT domain-containing protein [Anaerolineae bacterium]